MSDSVDTSDFAYKLDPMVPPDEFEQADTSEPEYMDVDSYEDNKSFAITNLKRLNRKLETALDVSLKLGDDANSTAALGKIAEIARVIMDSNMSIVEIARKDVEMKDEKEKARKAEEGAGAPGSGMSTKEIIQAMRELEAEGQKKPGKSK